MNHRITQLDNGLTVVTDKMETLESAALGFWVKSGARDEREGEHGIAHLLEHMAFKGTDRRSARDIAEEIENVGGELNAGTSVESTSYYARVLKDDVPLALDILSDILLNSRFDAGELEREQHVILQEIGAAEDTPDDIVFDHFQETAFSGQIVGRPILGTRESVKSFAPDDLRAYLARQYGPDRIVVSASGAVDHDAIVEQVSKVFSGRDHAMKQPARNERMPARYKGGEFRETRDLADAQLVLGFEGRPYYKRDFYASQVLSMVLGGGMSSRLFQEIREKRGLCYSIYAFHWSFSDSGLFGIHAATGEEELEELGATIVEELGKMTSQITEDEVKRARAQMRASLMMGQESPAVRAGQMARQLMFNGAIISNEELMDRLQAIDAARLTDLAGRLFIDGCPTLAAIGKLDRLAPAADLAMPLKSDKDGRRGMVGMA
ncbi:pitrilysin family protein [Fulvimarina sp. 2208YS6-2-32]|uniref:Pitrilysin family protein n=1 Tax=Fulvimarina uroteuthidis TaxID=3098149 RepID=A0ABU5I069_9HYPH|nr:pitrilysin family protein [Fulvimarina sp. 2208YS6-2-32]MDY8108522.1 pitrilysin family protein [Fulvimarina sp. 2208YS6-2-32]